MSYNEKSLINIIKRQQRKQIPSIINGVHIIPEELYAHTSFPNILYIILYVDSEDALWNHLKNRDPQKYTYQCVPFYTKLTLNYEIVFNEFRKKRVCYIRLT